MEPRESEGDCWKSQLMKALCGCSPVKGIPLCIDLPVSRTHLSGQAEGLWEGLFTSSHSSLPQEMVNGSSLSPYSQWKV